VRLLHVLSQTEVTGAETYAATLIAEQVKRGDEVTVVSDTLATPTAAAYVPMRIARRDFPQRIRNVVALRRLIRERKIDVVNAHSRASSWVAFFATRGTGVPLVSTIHSRQWVPVQSRWYSIYGERIVAVSESLLAHMRNDLGIPPSRTRLIRNALDLERFTFDPDRPNVRPGLGLNGERVIALVSRLSRGKAEVARFFVGQVFEQVHAAVGDATLLVVGGMRMPADFAELVTATNARLGGSSIRLVGHRPNVADYLQAADIVVGSGSVAMEALAMTRPVVALGEAAYLGVVSDCCAEEGQASFFGDHTEPQPRDAGQVAADVIALLNDPARQKELGRWGRSFVEQRYSACQVRAQFDDVYRQARLEQLGGGRIPVLMYHKVVKAPVLGSRHGTWVTVESFARQLASLKRRGMTTVTLRDCALAARGEKRLPRRPVILTFDDGYLDNYTNAFPLLAKLGMTGVIFLVADPALTSNAWDEPAGEPWAPLMGRDQVLEMDEYGIEFGSHTLNHPRLPDVPAEQLRHELCESKHTLEAWLGRPVVSLAYPYGAVNERVKRAAQQAGYQLAVATNSGPIRFGEDPFEIRRVHILPWSDRFQFWKRSSPWYFRYKMMKGNLPQH
jgi:peptidoglycan/xylan/chitin deacetylase (PgdA/CDA1 family)/glycosyltransferase involved in cell wall biosynthesis